VSNPFSVEKVWPILMSHVDATTQDNPLHLQGLAELADSYDVILSDVWGVVHNGVNHFTGAVDALTRFRAKGGTVVLITNAPNPNGTVRERLDGLGVHRAAYDAIVSSGDVTAALVAERDNAPFFHIGPARDMPLLDQVAALSGRTPRLAPVEEAEFVVCTGLFDEDTETPADYDPVLTQMAERGLDLICANPDIVVQVGETLVHCAGAIAARYAQKGGNGKILQAGKPFAPIYDKALGFATAVTGKGIDRSRVLAIGDAMHTDIEGARKQSLGSIFITSGIHRDELYRAEGGATGLPARDLAARDLAAHNLAALDMTAFGQFMQQWPFKPMAVLPALVW